MTPNEFFQKYRGKFLDFDGAFGAQCTDPIKAYFKEVLGIPPIKGNAVDYWKDIPGFLKLPYTGPQPKPNDIIVWGKELGQYGHIGICNWSRA